MRALVTGATGFLGLYIVEALCARGDQVRAFCRQPSLELEKLGVELAFGDLASAEEVARACRNMEVVFHVAGIAGIWGSWSLYYQANTVGTLNVLNGSQTHGVGRLVYTSTSSVTFDGSEQSGIDESAPYPQKWLCHYPHSKALAEERILAANGVNGLLTCSLRPHLIWGPRDRHLVPRLIQRAKCGDLRQVGDGANLVDMTYVENAAGAHLNAADALTPGAAACGNAYFISQGEPINCWQWINEILKLAHLPPVANRVSYGTAWTAGLLYEMAYQILGRSDEPKMTRFLAAQLAKSHFFNMQRARRDLGYHPQVSSSEGMRRLGEWLENRQSL